MNEVVRTIVESAFIPIAVGLVIWAVTQRKSDKAAIRKTLAEATKTEGEATVTEETVAAAVQLADIKTLQEAITTMGNAFREERESLTRRLETATETANTALHRQGELADEVDNLRADQERYHREVLDMYRRDQYHAHALSVITHWINDNLPKLKERLPELDPPPTIEPLPPLHVHRDEDIPQRRWYDQEPAVDPREQEL